MFGLSVLNFIARQGDVFVLGKVVTTEILGSYYLALHLAGQLMSLFSSVIAPVLLSAFSASKDNKVILKNSLLSVNNGVATLGIPLATFMAANSSGIISVLYGRQYTDAALALSLLSLTMFIRAQTAVLGQMQIGLGLPQLLRRESVKRTLLIVALMYPAVKYFGLSGAASVMFLASIFMLIFQLYSLKRILYFYPTAYFSKWLTGLGLAGVVLIPNGFLLLFKIDSFLLQAILAIGTMIFVVMFGFIKLAKPIMQSDQMERNVNTLLK